MTGHPERDAPVDRADEQNVARLTLDVQINCDPVSVIIPTIGRPEVARAVRSVRNQDYDGAIEIVLVADAPPGVIAFERDTLLAVNRVIWTGGGRGGSAARNAGVAAASNDWVAFLDDDDEWLPGKLRRQVATASAVMQQGYKPVVASRHVQVDRDGRESQPIPKIRYTGVAVADYLFRKRRAGAGRASIYTSTLLCPTTLAIEHPFNEELPRHQDWDWLLRLEGDALVRISQLEEPLAYIHVGSAGSISASTNWRDSLAWAETTLREHASPEAYADFLTAQCLRYAIAARSARGTASVIRALREAGTLPSLGPSAIAAAGVLPRRTIERLMSWFH